MLRTAKHGLAGALTALALVTGANAAQETIKIADIEALSGPMAKAGDLAIKHFQFIIDEINSNGGVLGRDLELLTYDSQFDPQASAIAAEKAVNEGAVLITQGSGSAVGNAINNFIVKNNRRNPDQRALFFNYASIDPALTDEHCNFWHFRFYAHTDMMVNALASHISQAGDIKKIFLINQDYSYGHAISAKANELIPEARPDVEIVGDIFHPVAKVKDFSPYISQIQASGADTVITGNWGSDMTLLIKAAADAGLEVDWYTFYGGFLGAPTAIGEAGLDHLKLVTDWHANVDYPAMKDWNERFQEQYGYDWTYLRAKVQIDMFVKALEQVGEVDPVKIAEALSGMRYETPIGAWTVREADHQAAHPIFVATFTDDVEFDVEDTGFGFRSVRKIAPEEVITPVQCQVEHP